MTYVVLSTTEIASTYARPAGLPAGQSKTAPVTTVSGIGPPVEKTSTVALSRSLLLRSWMPGRIVIV